MKKSKKLLKIIVCQDNIAEIIKDIKKAIKSSKVKYKKGLWVKYGKFYLNKPKP